MRRFLLTASPLALLLFASTAWATVKEPNGLQVPQPAPSGETSLNVFFAQRGDPVDWQADAAATPNAFSPLCGFTATFVFNQAGSHFGLAWYNETGQKPAANQLHTIFPANTAVGTMFTGTSIKNDPNYAGGLVGFALIGGETHYTNASYDNLCSGCNPQGPWITALMYASKSTANAYYICFEDGGTSASGWNNDGDFNDDVFFLTGLTCSGGGQPCDTGLPGVCASGVTQCTTNGTTCQQLSQPSAEKCNGLDDDCNGQTDEGDNLCDPGFVCDKGTCVQSCQNGEFGCPPNKICSADGHCVDPACKDVDCPTGQVCVAGTCKAPCDDVTCPLGQVCRNGVCLDPCAGVSCGSGQVCDQGVCVTSCNCLPCESGKACDGMSGLCVDPSCVGVMCAAGTACVGGTCADTCTGAMCPSGQDCMNGQCVDAPPQGTGGSTSVGFGVGGFGGGPSGTGGSGGHGGSSGKGTGGMGGSSASGSGGGTGSSGKCGCAVPGQGGDEGALAIAGLALMAVSMRRRRRA